MKTWEFFPYNIVCIDGTSILQFMSTSPMQYRYLANVLRSMIKSLAAKRIEIYTIVTIILLSAQYRVQFSREALFVCIPRHFKDWIHFPNLIIKRFLWLGLDIICDNLLHAYCYNQFRSKIRQFCLSLEHYPKFF